MKKFALIFGSIVALLLGATAEAQAACTIGPAGGPLTLTISFTPPTANVDGTAVAGPLSYNLYLGTTAGSEVKAASGLKGNPIVVNSATLGAAATALKSNTTAYIRLTVVDANGAESALSNEVCKTFPASVPGTVTITVQ